MAPSLLSGGVSALCGNFASAWVGGLGLGYVESAFVFHITEKTWGHVIAGFCSGWGTAFWRNSIVGRALMWAPCLCRWLMAAGDVQKHFTSHVMHPEYKELFWCVYDVLVGALDVYAYPERRGMFRV